MEERFTLGFILITPGAAELLKRAGHGHDLGLLATFVLRHRRGDWGDVCEEDAAANDYAAQHGLRILSAYELPHGGGRLWVITEADRSATTVLLPCEY